MMQDFCSIDWTQMFGFNLKDDVESPWQFFKSSYTELVNKYIPKRSRPMDPCLGNVKKCKYNKEIAVSVRKKHRLWQRYMETRDGQKYAAYVKARNTAKSLIKRYQRETCKHIAASAKTNPKKFWSYVNSKTTVKSEIPNLVRGTLPDGTKDFTSSSHEKAEVLSNFFSSVFTTEPPGNPSPEPSRDIKHSM